MNWKYILGEVVLLFISINLAIWFNNWNQSKKINKDKTTAIEKIVEEIQNNRSELEVVEDNNNLVLEAFKEFKNIYDGSTSHIIVSPSRHQELQRKYPDFFVVKDSVRMDDALFRYQGTTRINLELPDLTDIAWKITTALNIPHEFNYDCLFELESMYTLQNRVNAEINKSANALQNRELEKLINILEFINQLSDQLMSSYSEMLEKVKNCG